MMRFCPATGRLAHAFDKTTHRCRCGRWERGFKPKTEPVRDRAECQICERVQALDSAGRMGHHGYRRPGWGFIEGDCPGVGHAPYPATDALEAYRDVVTAHLAAVRKCLRALKTARTLTVKVGYRRAEQEVIVLRGAAPYYDDTLKAWVPGFEDVAASRKYKLEGDVKNWVREVERVTARIEKARTLA
jgi:hypothetical protein